MKARREGLETNANKWRHKPFPVWLLILLQALLAISALIPGVLLALARDGSMLGLPLWLLKDSPFTDYLIPGIILFVFVGVYPSAVAYGLWQRPSWKFPDVINPFRRIHWAWAGSLASGVIVIVWIIVEVLMIRAVDFLHYFYIGWGLALMFLTLLPTVRRYYVR